MIASAGKREFIYRSAAPLQPCQQRRPGRFQDLALQWPPRFLLDNEGSIPDTIAGDEIADPDSAPGHIPAACFDRQGRTARDRAAALLARAKSVWPKPPFCLSARFAPIWRPACVQLAGSGPTAHKLEKSKADVPLSTRLCRSRLFPDCRGADHT